MTISETFSFEHPKQLQCTSFKSNSTDLIYGNKFNPSDVPKSPRSVLSVPNTNVQKPLSLKDLGCRSMTQGASRSFSPQALNIPSKIIRPKIHRRSQSMSSYHTIQSKSRILNSSGSNSFIEDELDDLLECLKLRKSLYGDDHSEVAFVYNSIGNVYSKRDNDDEAMNSYIEALRIYRVHHGDCHPSIASTLQNIGNAHYRLGKKELAIQCMKQVLFIWEKEYGDNHSKIVETLQNLGKLYSLHGNHEQALKILQRALDMRLRQQEQEGGSGIKDTGKNNLLMARIMNTMGNVYADTGNLDMALKSQSESLRIKKLELGTLHASVAISLIDLGTIYHRLGDLDEAISFCKEALSIQKECYNSKEYNKDFGITLHFIGSLYQEKGEVAKAIKALTSASSYYQRASLKSTHPFFVALETDLDNLSIR